MKQIFTITALVLCTLVISAQHVARTMNFEGTSRKYMEYIPTSSPDGTMPVVFLLHGLGDNCNNFSQLGFEDVAPNWIIITPEATNATINVMGSNMSAGEAWAAGVGGENITIMGFPLGDIELNEGVNDEGFILAILDSLENNFNVDTDSVFVAGFSMGGFMSNKMAVKHADRITAVASVSGTLGHFQAFEPTGNINTMHIHGTADETISYANADFSINGIAVPVGLGAEALVETWRSYNQCSAEPSVYQYVDSKNDDLTFEQYTYKNEETNKKTVFIKVNNGIHYWYDGYNNDIDYNREIYNFFIGKEPESFTLTSTAGENGIISPSGEIAVNEGQYYTFTATPNEGYRVNNVTIDDSFTIGDLDNNTYTFQDVTANHSIHVTFEAIPTYTITSSAGENGSISPEGDTIVYEGTNPSFTITPDEGYRIASVIVDAETENETNVTSLLVNKTYTFTNITANHSIRATFEVIPTYTITSSAGENGSISPEGETVVYAGTNPLFTITPDEGYHIASVIVDAETENETNVTEHLINSTYIFQNVSANHTITATFEENIVNVDTNTVDNFSIYPNPAANIVNVTTDSNAELAIFNATGKEVKHINTNGNTTAIDISDLPNGLYFIVVNGYAQKLTIAR